VDRKGNRWIDGIVIVTGITGVYTASTWGVIQVPTSNHTLKKGFVILAIIFFTRVATVVMV